MENLILIVFLLALLLVIYGFITWFKKSSSKNKPKFPGTIPTDVPNPEKNIE